MRTIWSIHVRSRGPAVSIALSGNGFLYKMVRLIVGAMVAGSFRKGKAR